LNGSGDHQFIVASIDSQQLPDGIDGEHGAVIEGGFTIQSAQDLVCQIKGESPRAP